MITVIIDGEVLLGSKTVVAAKNLLVGLLQVNIYRAVV